MRHLTGLVVVIASACSSAGERTETSAITSSAATACASDNAGLMLPAGFCASIAADTVRGARHLVVAPNGDVFVAVQGRGGRGGVVAMRDTDGDGDFDVQERFGANGGNGIALRGNTLYFATNDAVLRYRVNPGELTPVGVPDTIVRELPAVRSHTAKTIVLGRGNELFVNIGSPSNTCQAPGGGAGQNPPGQDPCPELDTRAGVWLFDANKLNQRQSDGVRYATGIRNAVALTLSPDGVLYGMQHGRDQLRAWGHSVEHNAENPAEILMRIERGDDFGWPYCYYSIEEKKTVLAPEYGGDGKQIRRCADKTAPLLAFPGHWAPNGIVFYTANQFPERYRGGVFVAFHGSWNRAPLPQAGFNVSFVPMRNGRPTGNYEVFADNFAPSDLANEHRPVGVAVARDGSLLVTDDSRGRIYRISYRR